FMDAAIGFRTSASDARTFYIENGPVQIAYVAAGKTVLFHYGENGGKLTIVNLESKKVEKVLALGRHDAKVDKLVGNIFTDVLAVAGTLMTGGALDVILEGFERSDYGRQNGQDWLGSA